MCDILTPGFAVDSIVPSIVLSTLFVLQERLRFLEILKGKAFPVVKTMSNFCSQRCVASRSCCNEIEISTNLDLAISDTVVRKEKNGQLSILGQIMFKEAKKGPKTVPL